MPVIMINGRHSGLYEIHRERPDGPLRTRLIGSKPRRSKSIGAVVIDESFTRIDDNASDNDDGYRSLSRSSFRSSLMQKISDIRTRLLDLIDEIDQSIETQLTPEQAEAYRKRKNALVAKLDSLIDSCLEKLHRSSSNLMDNTIDDDFTSDVANESGHKTDNTSYDSSSQDSSTQLGTIVKNSSEINLYSDGYEDQIQIIDYNFKRRSSDNSALRKSARLVNLSFDYDARYSKTQNKPIELTNILPSTRQPIDFGAMMRDYENKKTGDNVLSHSDKHAMGSNSGTAQHHAISSSSTSTYSEQSSSSFL